MLKAVTFNKTKHAHLIKFLDEYKDENGKNNISSAIKYLMQKGYESIYPEAEKSNDYQPRKKRKYTKHKKEPVKEDIAESLKENLRESLKAELLSEMNATVLGNLSNVIDKLSNIQVMNVQQPVQEMSQNVSQNMPKEMPQEIPMNVYNDASAGPIERDIIQSKPIRNNQIKDNQIDTSTDSGSLLSNLLGNANK